MGRHSAPDDHEDTAAPVLSTPAGATTRPRPGRHSGGDTGDTDDTTDTTETDDDTGRIHGLDVIETVMSGDEPADDTSDPAGAADDSAGMILDDHTAQIAPIVDPVLDEPLPVAVTTVIAPVEEASARPSPSAPSEQASADPSSDPADDPTDEQDGKSAKAAKAEAKAASKAAKAEAKAAARTAKADARATKAASRTASRADKGQTGPTTAPTPAAARSGSRPDAKVSDLVLLRTDSAARARVIAAIVVPFLLYVGVLFVLDTFDLRTVLVWIWVPLVSAGVVAGLLLDLAHRAAAARAVAALETASEQSGR